MNQNIYDIEHNKLNRWLTPLYLRKPVILAWLNAIIVPFTFLYQDFIRYRDAKNYHLRITTQVCFLNKLLNDRYDFILRRIYITDGLDKPVTFIYTEAELKPLYLGSKFIYTPGETSVMSDDFIIYVPSAIAFEDAEMKSIVKAYKLAGTQFKIQRF